MHVTPLLKPVLACRPSQSEWPTSLQGPSRPVVLCASFPAPQLHHLLPLPATLFLGSSHVGLLAGSQMLQAHSYSGPPQEVSPLPQMLFPHISTWQLHTSCNVTSSVSSSPTISSLKRCYSSPLALLPFLAIVFFIECIVI